MRAKKCKHCRHSRWHHFWGRHCAHSACWPRGVSIDHERGKTAPETISLYFCSVARSLPHMCGPRARYFEPKPTFVQECIVAWAEVGVAARHLRDAIIAEAVKDAKRLFRLFSVR